MWPDRGTKIQSLIFDQAAFTPTAAKAWAREHKFKYGKLDIERTTIRVRQVDPAAFVKSTFRTIELRPGVKAVVGVPTKSTKRRTNSERKATITDAWFPSHDSPIMGYQPSPIQRAKDELRHRKENAKYVVRIKDGGEVLDWAFALTKAAADSRAAEAEELGLRVVGIVPRAPQQRSNGSRRAALPAGHTLYHVFWYDSRDNVTTSTATPKLPIALSEARTGLRQGLGVQAHIYYGNADGAFTHREPVRVLRLNPRTKKSHKPVLRRRNGRIEIRRGELLWGYEPHDMPGSYIRQNFQVYDNLGRPATMDIVAAGEVQAHPTRKDRNLIVLSGSGTRSLREATSILEYEVDTKPTRESREYAAGYRAGWKAKKTITMAVYDKHTEAWIDGWRDGNRDRKAT